MALQPTSMTHQAYAQFWGHDANDKKEEKSVGAKSAFIMGNYHCKPLMTDVTVIHKVKKKHGISAKVYGLPSSSQFWGHPVSISKEVHLLFTNIHANLKQKGKSPWVPRVLSLQGTTTVNL